MVSIQISLSSPLMAVIRHGTMVQNSLMSKHMLILTPTSLGVSESASERMSASEVSSAEPVTE